jgi:hypothetical protein
MTDKIPLRDGGRGTRVVVVVVVADVVALDLVVMSIEKQRRLVHLIIFVRATGVTGAVKTNNVTYY